MTEEEYSGENQDTQAATTAASKVPEPERGEVAAEIAPPLLSGVSPGRLAAPTPLEEVRGVLQQDWWIAAQAVALDWQAISVWADFWEFLAPRVQYGRGRELAGLIADGGERLALALASVTEAELWHIYRQDIPPEVRKLGEMERRSVNASNEMAHRAMAELASYYLLAAGHVLVNVTVRALALDTQLHPKLLDVLGSWYPVGSAGRDDWLSLNTETVRRLRRVARQAAKPAAQGLTESATALLMSPAWQEVDQLRGAHYHRRRPQSAGIDGVPLASPWTFSDGVSRMVAGGGQYTDGDGLADKTTDLVRRALAELTAAMQRLLVQVQAVVEEVKSAAGTR
jgi:hypothetical protein